MNTWISAAGIAAFVLLLLAAVRGSRRRLSGGCCGGGGGTVRVRRVSDRDPAHYPCTAVITVDGMVCVNCANAVANALNALPGVWAAVDLGGKKARVRMKERLDPDRLREAVRAAGPYLAVSVRYE